MTEKPITRLFQDKADQDELDRIIREEQEEQKKRDNEPSKE